MNAPDPWDDLAAAFADVLQLPPITPEELQKLADEYQAEQIETTQCEAHEQSFRSYK